MFEGLLFFWGFGTIVSLAGGLITLAAAYDSPYERQLGARLVLFCWAWPVLAIVWLARRAF